MAGVNSDVTATGFIKHGRLHIRNRRWFDEALRRFRDDAEVEVAVTLLRATRSVQANRYYWGMIVQLLSDHTGYTPEEIHELVKAKFLPKRLAVQNGNGEIVDEYVLGGSTRKLNTEDFSTFCESIRRWAAESLDLVIPDPGQADVF